MVGGAIMDHFLLSHTSFSTYPKHASSGAVHNGSKDYFYCSLSFLKSEFVSALNAKR